jgi:hypothetical protein
MAYSSAQVAECPSVRLKMKPRIKRARNINIPYEI